MIMVEENLVKAIGYFKEQAVATENSLDKKQALVKKCETKLGTLYQMILEHEAALVSLVGEEKAKELLAGSVG